MVRAVGAPPGAYDLIVQFPGEEPLRMPRAVWLRAVDPAAPAQLRVAQITDLHVGSGARAKERLDRVIADVNLLAPDLVLVTGDVANNGDRPGLMPKARDVLLALQMPLLVVPGNHDHGFNLRAFSGIGESPGSRHFADVFHAHAHFTVTLGGWDFIGFDSGPSRPSPLVRTRGLDATALASIARDLEGAHGRGRRGVVLFSHTPSRTRLTGSRPSIVVGPLARMGRGTRAFEDLLRDAGDRSQRVLHLTGHTHWTDVFELDSETRRFVRWDHKRLGRGPHDVAGHVVLINSQSASHSGIPTKKTGRGHGYTVITLGDGAPQLDFHRYE